MASVPSQVGREVGADTVEVDSPTSVVSPVDRTEEAGAERVDAEAVVAGVPSQVGREVGADTVEVGLPTLALGPVNRAMGAGAKGS